MSSPFAFVPRKVAKANKTPAASSSTPSTSSHPRNVSSSTSTGLAEAREIAKPSQVSTKQPATAVYSDHELVIIISLCLTDYALWSDPDTRRNIGNENCAWPFNFNIFTPGLMVIYKSYLLGI